MAVNAPQLLASNWNKFVENGATESCVYQKMDNTSYIPGNAVSKPILGSYPLEIVFDNRAARNLDVESTIRSIEQLAVFPSLLLPVLPEINDLIVDSTAREWEVRSVVKDPTVAVYELVVYPKTP